MSTAAPNASTAATATAMVHATAVALGPVCALLRGPPGAGKSDLALRFLAEQGTGPGADCRRSLVADDQTLLRRDGGRLIAAAPASIAGLIEVRGVGVLKVDALAEATVVAVVDCVPRDDVPRLPEGETVDLCGLSVPLRRLCSHDASAPLKLALLLARFGGFGVVVTTD